MEGLGLAIDKMLDRLFQMKPQSERTFAAVGELLSRWKKPEALFRLLERWPLLPKNEDKLSPLRAFYIGQMLFLEEKEMKPETS